MNRIHHRMLSFFLISCASGQAAEKQYRQIQEPPVFAVSPQIFSLFVLQDLPCSANIADINYKKSYSAPQCIQVALSNKAIAAYLATKINLSSSVFEIYKINKEQPIFEIVAIDTSKKTVTSALFSLKKAS